MFMVMFVAVTVFRDASVEILGYRRIKMQMHWNLT